MKIPSPVEQELLAIVVRERSGRDVAKEYEARTGRTIAYGTLYTTFRRLKDAGWVVARDDQDSDGRVRHFRITGLGEQALHDGRLEYARLSLFGVEPAGDAT